MTLGRQHVLGALIAIALTAAGVWLALHTEWVEVQVPDPLKGPALRDADYRLKQVATRLGAVVTAPDNLEQLPPPGATLVLSSAHWDIFPERVQALRAWVEAGGHLWLPYQGQTDAALAWIPVKWVAIPRAKAKAAAASAASAPDQEDDDEDDGPDAAPPPKPALRPASGAATTPRCASLSESITAQPAFDAHRRFDSCLYARETLRPGVPPQWALHGPQGALVARVPVGRGSVTVASAYMPWGNSQLLRSDNALLATAALRIHAGQQLWFVQDEARMPLLSFLWTRGTPAVLLGALALAFALWRGAVRFGPPAAALPMARRSMAEQIRGTAAFVAHHGSNALHAAQLRALNDTARPRVHGFDGLILGERAQAVAQLTQLDAHALARAMNPALDAAVSRHPGAALALLETARRRLLNAAASSRTAPRTDSR
ncbi:MAG: DUF4350 domain-containing protein [Burkholderiales bacterium]